MKKGLLAFAALAILTSCGGSDDDKTPIVLQDVTPIVNGMKSGTWRVTDYQDNGDDETNHFTDYTFTFADNNVLTATGGVNTFNGAWTVTNFKTDDDTPNNNVDFNIFFSAPADFEDISDDWDIVSRTDTKIVLIDNGSGGTDHLTFEKN
jgi:hypothetical protein